VPLQRTFKAKEFQQINRTACGQHSNFLTDSAGTQKLKPFGSAGFRSFVVLQAAIFARHFFAPLSQIAINCSL
jgi:hypothetical protein